ncbi:PEP-CTERM sorting domain-containing protein [Mitsuaria sp. WAJ17]|uniref:PEP-CTERM sorting domain-containing protein n=1 Tax=Mitsuaria sp. WAJ17 TaxID=2761452 RepID=UPI0016001AB3|nr:PEP-CTERM sorting domain-containing protein [Mitsuaria sp. WAJ17]MBB2485898.1 PEP-CTERM sorting domain-containing protein [Mitsuaria sp. WAJ17]
MKSATMALVASACLLSAGLSPAAPVKSTAVPIPIEEEFVVAQQLHVDASLDTIVMQLIGDGLFAPGAAWHYKGGYEVSETSPGVFSGSYTGVLAGSYLGEDWAFEYAAAMATDAVLNKVWNLDSKGKWKKGPNAGKNFKDKGKLTEKTDSTADLELEIETDGVTPKAQTTASNLKKEKGGGKLKVGGNIDVTDDKGKKHTEKLAIDLDQASKTFTSKLTSPVLGFDVVVLENTGSFTAEKVGSKITGNTSFDITIAQVPEPATPLLFAAGFGGFMASRRRKPA